MLPVAIYKAPISEKKAIRGTRVASGSVPLIDLRLRALQIYYRQLAGDFVGADVTLVKKVVCLVAVRNCI
jgi:hypothetical protein